MADKDDISEEGREALDSYFAASGSWASDRQDSLRRSRTIAWIIAGIAIAIAFFEALALLFLTPLKTVEPYTLLVDKQTGYVELLKPLEPQLVSGKEALTESFLVQYVTAREGFDINALRTDYRKTALWSAGPARSAYLASAQASNPGSYLATLPRSTIIDVRVKSVSHIGENVAMVRFDTIRSDAGGQISSPRPWVAVIRYRYSGEPMQVEDRYINPLGFQVTSYRRSAEALPQPELATTVVIEPPQETQQAPAAQVPAGSRGLVPGEPARRVPGPGR